MFAAGILVLSVGVLHVWANTLSVGGLLALMILIWRVLTPIKILFSSQVRLKQISFSIGQINSLLALAPERETGAVAPVVAHLQGQVEFNKVSMRYGNEPTLALTNLNFVVKPGEVIAIVGRNGVGKTTLLKLLLGLYKPQAGTILFDGVDSRQLDPIELRQAISYVPQICQLFYGTVAQNLRLVSPLASDEMLRIAAEQANVLQDILALPDGFNTRLHDQDVNQCTASFLQRLSLARAYLKKSTLLLLDEPASTLDVASDTAFLKAIASFRTQSTIFMITHRPSHMRIADRIIWLQDGQIMMAGPTEQIWPHLPKEFK